MLFVDELAEGLEVLAAGVVGDIGESIEGAGVGEALLEVHDDLEGVGAIPEWRADPDGEGGRVIAAVFGGEQHLLAAVHDGGDLVDDAIGEGVEAEGASTDGVADMGVEDEGAAGGRDDAKHDGLRHTEADGELGGVGLSGVSLGDGLASVLGDLLHGDELGHEGDLYAG